MQTFKRRLTLSNADLGLKAALECIALQGSTDLYRQLTG